MEVLYNSRRRAFGRRYIALDNIIFAIIKTARPRQWVKNLSIFAALIFTGSFFSTELFWRTALGFALLSILVSSVYFINDIADVKVDKLHPFKKNRPIAKGILPVPFALFLALLGITISLFLAHLLSSFFFLTLLSYRCFSERNFTSAFCTSFTSLFVSLQRFNALTI